MSETIRELLLKIKALADRGVGGERDAAQEKLSALLKKHGLTPDDITEQDTPEFHSFAFTGLQERDVLMHVAMSVLGTKKIRHFRHSRSISMELTKIQAADLKDAWTHYRKALKEEMRRLFVAFVNRHNLFAPDSGEDRDAPIMSIEELERLIAMMNGMGSKTWDNRLRLKTSTQPAPRQP